MERSLIIGKAESLLPAADKFPPDNVKRDRRFRKKQNRLREKQDVQQKEEGMKTGGKIVRREEKSAKNTPIISK